MVCCSGQENLEINSGTRWRSPPIRSESVVLKIHVGMLNICDNITMK